MRQTLKNDGKPSLTDLMFHPDRKMLKDEIDMVLERAKQNEVERGIIADTMYHYLRQHMTPTETMTDVDALRWINQLRRYHSEIGNTLDILEQIVALPSISKTE